MRRIALVTFGDPHELPPTLNLAHVLRHRGWEVDLVGIHWRGRRIVHDDYPEGASLKIVLETGPGIAHAAAHLRFTHWCSRQRGYDWVYAFDLPGAAPGAAMARNSGARFAYHLHDLAPPGTQSRVARLLFLKAREHAAARRADLVVLPQPERALMFAAEAGLKRPPVVALNCPPLEWPERAAPLPEKVAAALSRWPKLVVYQGGLSRARGVEALIDSVPYWPESSALVLVGDLDRHRDTRELEKRARPLGDRICWTGLVPYGAVPAVTRAARLGVLLTPGVAEDINLYHLAGASNKVFEYLACGLPALVPDTPGFFELIEEPGHGQVCRDLSPRALAAQIAALVDDERFAAISARNREAFREKYHYEHQLRPVLDRLDAA